MPVSTYLDLFNRHFTAFVDEAPPFDCPVGVSTAWHVSLTRLRNESPAAERLLHVLARLAPEPVPTAVFTRLHDEGPAARSPVGDLQDLAGAVRAISRYGLARVDHLAGTVEVHRLMSAVLREAMSEEEEDRSLRLARSLAALLPPGPSRTAHLLACRAAESQDPVVRSAILDQLVWSAAEGSTEDEHRLAEAAYDTWSRSDTATAAELTAVESHMRSTG